MKHASRKLLVLVVSVLPALPGLAATDTADRFMDALERADFTAAHAMFDQAASEQLSAPELERVWQSLPAQLGPYRARGPARAESTSGPDATVFRLEFENMALDARVTIDDQGRVSGFRLVPAAPASDRAAAGSALDPGEIEVRVGGELPGVLRVPAGQGPFPAVVLVHGSGPNDRDATIGPNKPFRDIAAGLADRGIASLRYDKRTRVTPEAFDGRAYTVEDEVIADAVVATRLLREHPQVDPAGVFLVGHSLGAMLAPRIAVADGALAGMAMLAAPARPLHEVVPSQIRYIAGLDGKVSEDERAALATIEDQAARVLGYSDRESAASGLLGLPESYLIDLREYDPVAMAESLDLPMLIAQGGRDYQVTVEDDFARWQSVMSGRSAVRTTLYESLNHLFISGDGMATPTEYMTRAGHVDDRLLDDLADFIHEQGSWKQ
ncbi:MAG TPA: alpha/beta fold hydrolase [Wenzhouxiangellaceae bacterium]|nr:alpha/beta fold hydrolase [Wenzhouxiangellaceae bacterium]